MRRERASVAGIAAGIMVVMMGWQSVNAESPKLFLGLSNPVTGQGGFGSYQPGVSTDLTILCEQFPQYSCIKFGNDGKLLGLIGTRLEEIDPVTGEATLWRDLSFYCGWPLDLTSFAVAEFGFFAHEYAVYCSEPRHILHVFLYGEYGIHYYSAVIWEEISEGEYAPLKRMYGIEWVDGELYAVSDTEIYRINPNGMIAESKFSCTRFWNITYGADGMLYGTDPLEGIYAIDPKTGASQFVENFAVSNGWETWGAGVNLFRVEGIVDNRRDNTGNSPYFTINGSGFMEGISVLLRKPGQPDIVANEDFIIIGEQFLSCCLQYENQALGYWDLVVTNNGPTKTVPRAFEIYLAFPRHVRVTPSGEDSSCEVTWDAVYDADEYYVECSEDEEFSTVLCNSGWIPETTYTFTELEVNHEYYFRVKARTLPRQCIWTQTTKEDFDQDLLIGTTNLSCEGDVVLDENNGGEYVTAGSVISPTIAFAPGGGWETLNFTKTDGGETTLTVDIYDPDDGTLLREDVQSGSDLSDLPNNKIVLKANLETTNSTSTPVLLDWSVGYYEQFESDFSLIQSTPLFKTVFLQLHVEIRNSTDDITSIPVTVSLDNPAYPPMMFLPPFINLDANGNFDFGGMMSGVYEVHVSAPGYHEWVRTINLTESTTLNVVLYHVHPGDADADGKVDSLDEGIVNSNMGSTEWVNWNMGDFNGDGVVDQNDMAIWTSNNGYASYALTFTVELADFTNNLNRLGQQPVEIYCYDSVSQQLVRMDSFTLTDNPGTITIPNVEPGTYDMCIKACRFLSASKTGIVVDEATTISESFTLANGDVNRDSQLTASDIDVLATAINENSMNIQQYDLDGDGMVDGKDKDYLIHAIFHTEDGDVNLDGMVDVGDLGILAANYGTTSGATWEMADFTGDGAVDYTDFDLLKTNYETTQSSGSGSPEVTVSVDPGVDIGNGFMAYTVHLVANTEANKVVAFEGGFSGQMRQVWYQITTATPTPVLFNGRIISTAKAIEDSHFMVGGLVATTLEEDNDLSITSISEGIGTYLNGALGLYSGSQAVDLTFAQIVIPADQQVTLNGVVSNANGDTFTVTTTIPQP